MTTATDPFAKAAEALSGASTVALACHVNPDADALGSMLGLSNHLRALGTQTVCSFPNDPFEPPRWASMLPGTDALVPPSAFPNDPAVMVTCDVASLDRLASLGGPAVRADDADLDRPSRDQRGPRDDPDHRSVGVVDVRAGLAPAEGARGRDPGRDRDVPVRGARHRHRAVPVRGGPAGHAPPGGGAPRVPVRPHQAGPGALRGPRGRVPRSARHRRSNACGSNRTPTSCGPTSRGPTWTRPSWNRATPTT